MKLLETTLAEEKKTDETLTQLAESEVNQHAHAALQGRGADLRKRPRISGTIIARILDIGASALIRTSYVGVEGPQTYSNAASDVVDESRPGR